MSRGYGGFVRRAERLLVNWRDVASRAARIIREVVPRARIYVFGSVVKGRATPASDVDLLVVVPSATRDLRELYVEVVSLLEDRMGEDSYVLDVHLVRAADKDKAPYKWWLSRAVEVEPSASDHPL